MEPPAALKLSPDGTQHSERHHVIVSMVSLTGQTLTQGCPVRTEHGVITHTALAMSIYAMIPCSNLQGVGALSRDYGTSCM